MSHNKEIKDTNDNCVYADGDVSISDPYGIASRLMPMMNINISPTINMSPTIHNVNTNTSSSVSHTSNPVTDNRKTNPDLSETSKFASSMLTSLAALLAK